ncbi:MAG: hypothetical protein R6X08_09515 [Desulfosalsimonadaceae bacterium]
MIIIDFEASSLRKNSYPIEVAWGDSTDNIQSYLLNPDYMEGWTDWNPESHEYHGLTREELRRLGEDPRQVAGRMVEELAEEGVYSDEPHYDIRWKNRLLADSGYDPALIRIHDLNYYLNELLRGARCDRDLNDFICTFECSGSGRHRAAADVYWLIEFVAYIRRGL